jgi:HPr kinase/phosphorylase
LSEKPPIPGISIKTLFEDNKKRLQLELLCKKGGLKKQITDKELHRPGLALAGFVELFTFHRVQICGNTEISYLKKLNPTQREKTLNKVFSFDIPCFIVSDNNRVPDEFIRLADQYNICVFRTPFATTKLIQLLADYLDEHFAPTISIHGSMVDVYGIGLMFTGRSGIGKSEVALDLVARGHRLVADDVVTIARRTGGVLIGKGNPRLGYHMQIRGLGIIDVQAIFGIRGIRRQKRVEVQVELVDWDDSQKYERLGLEDNYIEILNEKIPLIRLPIYPGKNITVIAEVIALNQLLKLYGHHSAKIFEENLHRKMSNKIRHQRNNLGHDFE